jgi:nuclear RNA export factor
LQIYFKNGRNLRHFRGHEYRLSNLKRGKLTIVALLSDLPPTKHDLQSFAVDLTFFTVSKNRFVLIRKELKIYFFTFQQQMIILTVTGLFKERNVNSKNEYIRAFQKTLVIVPNQGGFCIKNEMLHLNNASQMQAKNIFKTPSSSSSSSSLSAPANINNQIQQAQISHQQQPQTLDDSTKLRMIEAMSQQSNMNLEWSKKCLEETSWDFSRAGYVFQELFKQNKIPPEAFVK